MTPPPLTATRPPMASALGVHLIPGDRVGSLNTWTVRVVQDVIPGDCTDLAGALKGTCPCAVPKFADTSRMPRRVVLDSNGQRQVLFDHVRYAIGVRRDGDR